jgi:hypothetical protein
MQLDEELNELLTANFLGRHDEDFSERKLSAFLHSYTSTAMSEIPLPPWPWESPPDALAQALAEGLADQFSAGPIYLLIDPHLGDPPGIEPDKAMAIGRLDGMQRVREAVWRRPIHALHPAQSSDVTEFEFPYLVRLEDAHDPWLTTSVEWAIQEHLNACAIGSGPYRMGGWLQPHSVDEGTALSRQLHALMRYTDDKGELRLARLSDRRVLHTLRKGTQIEWEKALQGIARWSYLDHNFALQTLQGHDGIPASTPLMWCEAHQDVLNRSQALHLVQAAWLRTTFPLPDGVFDRMMHKVRVAEQRRLVDPKDQATYAAEALAEPAFEHWPKLPEIIDIARRTCQELSDSLDYLRPNWAGRAPDHWTVDFRAPLTPFPIER